MSLRVVIEVAERKAFASAVDWPGWSRGAKKVAERGMAELRRDFVDALAVRAEDRDLPKPNKVKRPWGPRYAARRSAWHALDHAWEIEDRSPG